MCNENIWCWGNVYKNQLWNINVKHETLLQWGKVIYSQQGGASLYKSIYVTRDKVAAEPASHWSILGLPRSDWLTQMVAYITLHKRAVASGWGTDTSYRQEGPSEGLTLSMPHRTIALYCSGARRDAYAGWRAPPVTKGTNFSDDVDSEVGDRRPRRRRRGMKSTPMGLVPTFTFCCQQRLVHLVSLFTWWVVGLLDLLIKK